MENINKEKKQKIQRLLALLMLIKAKVVVAKAEKETIFMHEITTWYLENDWENTMSKGPHLRRQHIEFDPVDVWINKMGLNK